MKENSLKKLVGHEAPTYKNTTKLFSLEGVDFYLWDAVKAALAGRLNIGLGGGAGLGKSQLFADIQALVGNNASYALGRNDMDIKSLFRKLNFKPLVKAMKEGKTVSQKALSQITADIYRPIVVVEEINRCAELVQNQLFNIFEGFIEIDGEKYSLGGTDLVTFKDFAGKDYTQNVAYSVGVWSANFGHGHTGTVAMDTALKERSHLIVDVDNFVPGKDNPEDLDDILTESGGEVRLKEQENPKDRTKDFIDAFHHMKQKAYTPDKKEIAKEMLAFRYLIHGLDYIPCENADNSKRVMKEVWPSKAEEDSIGTEEDDKIMYRMVYPASVRGAQTIIMLARALREYAKAKDPKSDPGVLSSVIESFKLVAPYSGIIYNPQRIREDYVGNHYKAACKVGDIIQAKFEDDVIAELIDSITLFKSKNEPLPKEALDYCKGEFACFR